MRVIKINNICLTVLGQVRKNIALLVLLLVPTKRKDWG